MMYKLLMAGDSILNVTDNYVVIERIDGRVDLYGLSQDNGHIIVTEEPIASIGYVDEEDDEVVEKYVTDNGIEVIYF